MPRKVLGQSAPAATTPTALYTVPASTETIVSTLTICNRGSTAGTVRVAVLPDGGTVANEDYVLFDHSVAANDMLPLTIGMTLDASDKVEVYASTANFTFIAFGQEVSA